MRVILTSCVIYFYGCHTGHNIRDRFDMDSASVFLFTPEIYTGKSFSNLNDAYLNYQQKGSSTSLSKVQMSQLGCLLDNAEIHHKTIGIIGAGGTFLQVKNTTNTKGLYIFISIGKKGTTASIYDIPNKNIYETRNENEIRLIYELISMSQNNTSGWLKIEERLLRIYKN